MKYIMILRVLRNTKCTSSTAYDVSPSNSLQTPQRRHPHLHILWNDSKVKSTNVDHTRISKVCGFVVLLPLVVMLVARLRCR